MAPKAGLFAAELWAALALVLRGADVLSVATRCGAVGREAGAVYGVDTVGPLCVAVVVVRAPVVSEAATTVG